MVYIPSDVRNIIILYINEIELYEKLDVTCSRFLVKFANVYRPISTGQMDAEPNIYNNFKNHHKWPQLEQIFKRANVLFNHYCFLMLRVAIEPDYWIYRTMNTIDWNGVAIMARGHDFEFIKLQGKYDGFLTQNGYTLFNVCDFV